MSAPCLAGEFVDRILQEVEERHLRQIKLRGMGWSIWDIVQKECRKRMVSEQELRKGRKGPFVSEARAAIAYRSKEGLGISAPKIANHLGINTSSITRGLAKMDKFIRD